MKKILLLIAITNCITAYTQQWHSATILHQLHKAQVHASVLYIAAHPDDENTRLLAYLANERKYRTGYLSLTRGDGGQNLIGNEQGVELGLIRTQELLAARKIDGAEQFFSTAYDFGYSKTSAETFTIWNKQKVLADAVWVIRNFKPDIIITRFPEDARAGHGHHSASGIIAREAYYAAADPTQFTEQLTKGVTTWQAKRIIWNTFNFGSNNTITTNQLKIDVGGYNTLLGKSYGEIAAESRSQHKSQGFGVPSQRGTQWEYFVPIAGDTMVTDIMDGVNTQIHKYATDTITLKKLNWIHTYLAQLIKLYNPNTPETILPNLIQWYTYVQATQGISNHNYYTQAIQNIILNTIGLYTEATTTNAYATQGDSIKINVAINARLTNDVQLKNIYYKTFRFDTGTVLSRNKNFITSKTILLSPTEKLTQPYWLTQAKTQGNFTVDDPAQILLPDGNYEQVQIAVDIMGTLFIIPKQLQYKHTDPVRGELYQPLYIVPPIDVQLIPNVVLHTKQITNPYTIQLTPKTNTHKLTFNCFASPKICGDTVYNVCNITDSLIKNKPITIPIPKLTYNTKPCSNTLYYCVSSGNILNTASNHIRVINYDHIPTIMYLQKATVTLVNDNIVTTTKKVGYIQGAGDKVPEALLQLGYSVDVLTAKDVVYNNIKKYDAIITGIRAYNTNDWLNDVYTELEQYVTKGGNLIIQYNTSNQIGNIQAKITPYNFTISRNRITNENAQVTYINPKEAVLQFPNIITKKDFDGWVQERSIYEATALDPQYRTILSMQDVGENATDGSLIIAKHNKGNYVYCSLALFRQLPAGVAGAYKLLANMVSLKNN